MNRSFAFLDQIKNKLCSSSSLRNFALVMVVIGVILRLIQYSLNRSLWLDECFVALTVVNKPFLALLNPIDYFQVTPVGFLIIEKAFVVLLGNNEYILRLYPLVSGIVSLFLIYYVARHCIGEHGALIAVGLFSLSGFLIYYSSEVKQYSSDVTFALLLLAVTMHVRSSKFSGLSVAFFGVIGAISVWFSLTSVFVLTGIGCTLSLFSVYRRDWSANNKLLIIYFMWLLGCAVFYFIYLRNISNTLDMQQSYWDGNFMPFPPMSVSDIKWFGKTFFEIFKRPIGLHQTGLGALAFLLGTVSIFLRDRELFFILISPLFVLLFVSALHIYPIKGRVIIFIVPFLLLFIGEGVIFLYNNTRNYSGIVALLLVGLLFYGPLTSAANHAVYRTNYTIMPEEDTRSVMNYIEEHKKPGDLLYLYHYSIYPFRYYSERYGFNDDDYIEGIYSIHDWDKYSEDLEKLRGNKRVWLMFSHSYKEDGNSDVFFYLNQLDHLGKRIDSFYSYGAAVYLYDLSKKHED